METKESTIHKPHVWTAQSQRVMLICVIVCVTICALLFTFLGIHMSDNSSSAIDYIGQVTMRDASKQFMLRFEAIMEQRLTMVEALTKNQTLEKYDNDEELYRKGLAESAKARDFTHLAFIRVNKEFIDDPEEGRTMDFIYGDFIVTDLVPFRQSILDKQPKIAVGKEITKRDEQGNAIEWGKDLVLFEVPTTEHIMRYRDDDKSMAMIAAISNADFVKMLNGNDDVTKNDTETFIVRRDNSFVFQSDDGNKYDNLTHLLQSRYSESEVPIDNIIKDLDDAMQELVGVTDNKNVDADKDEVYSNILHVGKSHVYMYCSKLAQSEWYLVSFTSNSNLNSVVEDLNSQWTIIIVVAVVAVIAILIIIFALYNYFNKQMLLQLENARTEALNASKAKSEFLSNMSHDIRTPMNAIVGMTAIARANIGNVQQVGDCLKKISLSSKHLLGLINDVLDMSKIESGKMTLNMEQVSLREVLDGITTIVQPQMKTKRQNFNVIVRNIEQEKVYCDSVRLNQVLLNLLSNAIKFTAEEGTIEIYLDQETSPLGDDFVRTHIRVKDNGIGMSDEFQKKIFESFTREDSKRVHHTEGSGLGMAITKYIVDAMKGQIELKSELGMGTQFHIILDLERALVPEEDMILPNWKMLLVDDDQQLCETTKVALKEIGIDADWTLDGESAVDITIKAHAERHPYDIILLDWKLPGIDGIETAKRIRKQLGEDNVPILLISAYDWSEIEAEARDAGICGFISKPLFKSTLFYGLKSFAGDSGASPDSAVDNNKKVDLKGLHVLLAEDNDLNWEIAETLLDSVGITCDHAENGQICVDMFKKSTPGTYKAILMDIRMPVMTGYEATVEIRKLDHPDKDLPIIAMTADAFADDMKKCLECGMNAHIAKPIDIDIVQNTLAKFIKRQ